MFGRLSAVACLATTAFAGVGPQALYQLLNGQTFNPPGYTIVAYQSCMQNQNAGNPCGSFSTYESANGVYTTQLYGPEAAVSPTCSRTFRLTLACGPTTSMSGVNENPTCVYSATLTLPQACGIDMRVGFEAASVSGTALPPTPSITRSTSLSVSLLPPSITSSISTTMAATVTVSGSGTASVLGSVSGSGTNTVSGTVTMSITSTTSFSESSAVTPSSQYVMTAYPSQSTSPSVLATTTPLFMVTGFPTTSPVNVTATSSPLFMYSAYPSVAANASGGGIAAALGITPGSSTATILSAVAIGVIGVVAVIAAIVYFKKGGTVSGLLKKVDENKGLVTQAAAMLPLSEAQKQKLDAAINDPTTLLSPEAATATAAAIQQAKKIAVTAEQYKQQVIEALPISDEQKSQMNSSINSLQAHVTGPVVSRSAVTPEVTTSVTPAVTPEVTTSVTPAVTTSVTPVPVKQALPKPATSVPRPVESTTASPSLVAVHISPADLADVQAFLASKQASAKE